MKTKVIKIYEPGSVDVLKIEEVKIDKPGLNEVLIEHSYAGLNFIDINQRRGTYPLKNLPQIMGMEASGIIKEVGQNVSKFKIGDKVTHCMNLGSYSKLMILNQDRVIKLKNDVDLSVAAASTLQGTNSTISYKPFLQIKAQQYCFNSRYCWWSRTNTVSMGKKYWSLCNWYSQQST